MVSSWMLVLTIALSGPSIAFDLGAVGGLGCWRTGRHIAADIDRDLPPEIGWTIWTCVEQGNE